MHKNKGRADKKIHMVTLDKVQAPVVRGPAAMCKKRAVAVAIDWAQGKVVLWPMIVGENPEGAAAEAVKLTLEAAAQKFGLSETVDLNYFMSPEAMLDARNREPGLKEN